MRVVNRLLALLVGLALAGAAAVAVAEIVAALLDRGPLLVPRDTWATALTDLGWSDPVLIAVCIGLIVVGLALLLFEFFPRRPLELPLLAWSPDRTASIDRRGLQERLRRIAVQDPDVVAARVRVRRAAHVSAQAPPDANRRQTETRLLGALTEATEDMQLERRLKVKVDVAQARERVR